MIFRKYIISLAILFLGFSFSYAAQEATAEDVSQEYHSFANNISEFRKNFLDLERMRREYSRCYKIHVAPIEAKIKELEEKLQRSDVQDHAQLKRELDAADRLRDEKYAQHCRSIFQRINTLERLVSTTRTVIGIAASVLITMILSRVISKKLDSLSLKNSSPQGQNFGSGIVGGGAGVLSPKELRERRLRRFENR